ncbi:hypothetical protein AB0K51_20370 [Kitasatospora sp. NPDC049285]|uniref:hypothetical protein n=1 Tax=Kitasatospora sp. NPDC049285 TaxID=3157096 RepID=UPI0034210442
MAFKALRPVVAGKALAVGAALVVVAASGTAYANTVGVTVRTPGATPGPGSANSSVSTSAHCTGGLVSGGGINQAIGSGAGVNGNHVMGSESTEYTGSTGAVGTDVTYWIAKCASGGQVNSSFSTTPYAMCFTSSLIAHTQVVMNKANTPTSATTVGIVTATCPANTVLLGGGALLAPGTVGTLKPVASFPSFDDAAHDHGRKAAADGETNPDSWTAVGGIGGGRDAGNTTYAYAICSGEGVNVRNIGTTVRYRESAVPRPRAPTRRRPSAAPNPTAGTGTRCWSAVAPRPAAGR